MRQETKRGRVIAGLFRQGKAKQALDMKREDGTARLIGGDQDQVVERIADLYMQRRDVLRAAGSRLGVTVSALTNEDAADISRIIRARMKERGELGADERVYEAVDQRGQTYDLPIATGDKVRLFRKTLLGSMASAASSGPMATWLRSSAGPRAASCCAISTARTARCNGGG